MTLTVVGTVALDTLAHVQRLAKPEETGGIVRIHPDLPGGTAGNVAMALARLGAPPRLLAAVGADFAGSAYERALAAAGVDLRALVRSSDPTSRAYVFFDPQGVQSTYFYAGSSRALDAGAHGELGRAHFSAGEISQYPALMQRAEWVSFDPGQEVHHRPLPEIVACFPHVDLLFLNEHERARLHDDAGLDLAKLHARGIATIVETRGARGAIVHHADGRATEVPAAKATAREPTGAGDAHRAGFLYALERGASAEDAAGFGNVVSAFVVESIGAQAGLPTLAEARKRYRETFGTTAPV